MLKATWKLIRFTLVLIGVLLSFIAFMELVRAYQTLRNIHPLVGWLYAAVIAVAVLWVIVYYWKTIGSRPRVLTPPAINDFENAGTRPLRKYGRYLSRYLERLSINPNLSEEQKQRAKAERKQILQTLEAGPSKETLLTLIQRAEKETIDPLLEVIDQKANRHVRDSMRDVMVFVTLSPYKSIDLAIVIYRNIRMVVDLIRMYNARPALKEQFRIFIDIFTIVATVNYIHLGRNLLESLGSHVPGVGRFLDDIAQGIGAGFLTTVTGHAAMQRCRAFSGWNPKQARDSVLSQLGDFYVDVRDVFFKDVWGLVTRGSGEALASAKGAAAAAIDETGRQLGKWIRVPVDLAVGAGNIISKPFRREKSETKKVPDTDGQ